MSFAFIVEMAWKSALISGAALGLAALLRGRSADERSAVLRAGVALIVALPLASLFLPALPVVTSTVHEAAPSAVDTAAMAAVAAAPAAAAPSTWDDPRPLLEWLWAGGAAMVLLRLLAGLWTLRRWTRDGEEAPAQWRAVFEAMKGPRAARARLLVGDAPAPLSWGWLRPVVLIDRDTAREPAQAAAVLAHELAHVERRDWLMLILARLAVAAFWFNPLMWLLERRMVDEAEQAADARALGAVEPARYAEALLSCARPDRMLAVPAAGMAEGGRLAQRVKAVLEGRLRARVEPRHLRIAILSFLAVAAPIAALKPVAAVIAAPEPAPAAPIAAAVPAVHAAVAPAAPAALPSVPHLAHAAQPAPAVPPVTLAAAAAAAAAPPPPPSVHPVRPPAPPAPVVDVAEIERTVREALAATAGVREEAIRQAAAAAGQAAVEARRGLAEAAVGMESGAKGMERGAEEMERHADKLREPAYRAQQIADSARRGKTLTDRQLLDMIPQLKGGAEGMRKGAEEMRRAAERMRRGG